MRKAYHFLDVLKFARPDFANIDPEQTALEMQRQVGGGFLSYGSVYARLHRIAQFPVDDIYLDSTFSFYKDDWKNRCLKEVAKLLGDYFNARGNWYSTGTQKRHILGTNFHPAQQGVWFVDGRAYNVLINSRKGQPLLAGQERFLARAMYELHGIDDPNEPDQIIIETTAPPRSKDRRLLIHNVDKETAIPLEEFEEIMHKFFDALAILGAAHPPKPGEAFRDLFRR